jgi:UDPglucose 6-dehydrogenase
MKVCVVGLWHLGTVTAACLAAGGHDVVGLDLDGTSLAGLQAGQPPVFEPGLADLVKTGLAAGRLQFTADIAPALAGADVVWIAYDTPVDDEDRADVGYVVERVGRLYPYLSSGTLVLISSQLPVGTTRRMEQAYAASGQPRSISFAYSPENLRLGKAIDVFTQPDRVVVGIRSAADQVRVSALLKPFTDHIEWMSVESAEMTKHALNAFLATCVTFINEIAVLCEQVGADAKEVERGLKSEGRIGAKAYLSPGAAFAGGTLARDIVFLNRVAEQHQHPMHLLAAVKSSNDAHKLWVRHKLQELIPRLRDQTIAVWGLTYKPGTDTLRRSSSVELCRWLAAQGALVQAHDPAIKQLPAELQASMMLCSTPVAALADAVALVVATEWQEYATMQAEVVVSAMQIPLVIDPNRFLLKTLGSDNRIRYVTVGKAIL